MARMRGKLFAEWINELDLGPPIGAEIGVKAGSTTVTLLSLCPALRLICIDPWSESGDTGSGRSQEEHDENYRKFLSRIAPYRERVVIVPMQSLAAVDLFCDSLLHFVILDEDHSWQAVLKSCNRWWNKISWGGFLAGRHYYTDMSKGRPRGQAEVAEAVDKFSEGIYQPPTIAGTSWRFDRELALS